jgi:hypothetical protein
LDRVRVSSIRVRIRVRIVERVTIGIRVRVRVKFRLLVKVRVIYYPHTSTRTGGSSQRVKRFKTGRGVTRRNVAREGVFGVKKGS